MSLEERCRNLLSELSLINADDALLVEPLSGGVASDIAKVTAADQSYCVKFALPKLRVKQTGSRRLNAITLNIAGLKLLLTSHLHLH